MARYKLIFYVPHVVAPHTASSAWLSPLEKCKQAIFAAGAGSFPGPGNYTRCAWSTLGTGQFLPGDTANPNIGTVGTLEEVQEYRVETVCQDKAVAEAAVKALKDAHPYEEPAYEVFRLEDF